MTTNGPYLYDDNPEPLHTGTGRNRNWTIILLLGLTVLLAVGTIVGMYVFRGSPEDEAKQVAGVFVAALAAGDDETASGLLCEELSPTPEAGVEALEPYRATAGGTVGVPQEEQTGDGLIMVVPVRSDAGETELVLVPEGGPRVCGLR